MLLTRDKTGIFSWEFSEKYLIERCGERVVNRTLYFYDPTENKLVIDRSDLEPDGFVSTCYEERFRVEAVGGETLVLSQIGM